MTSAVYLSLGILVLGLGIQFFGNKSGERTRFWAKTIFFGSAGAVFVYYLTLTFLQYLVWKNGGVPSVYFLPPYESIFYLLNYHFIRFLLYYFISFGAALLFLNFAEKYNRKMGFKFFEKEEPYFGALSIFILGNPAWPESWIYYVAAVFLISVAVSLLKGHFLKKEERFPLYHLWFPVAILVILISVTM